MLGRPKLKRGAASSPKLKREAVTEIQTPSPPRVKRGRPSADAAFIIKTEKSNSNLDSGSSTRICSPSSRFEIENVSTKPSPKRERIQPKRKRQQKDISPPTRSAKSRRSQKPKCSEKSSCSDVKESPNEIVIKKEIDTFGLDGLGQSDTNSGHVPVCLSPLSYQFPSDLRVKKEIVDYSQEIIDLTEDIDAVPVENPNSNSHNLAISLCQELSKCENEYDRLKFFQNIIDKYKQKEVSTFLNELTSTKKSRADAENSMNLDRGCYNSASIPENEQNYLLLDSSNHVDSPDKEFEKTESCHVMLEGTEGSFKSTPDSCVSSSKERIETIPFILPEVQLESDSLSVSSSPNLKKRYYSQRSSSGRKKGKKRVINEVSQVCNSSDSCLENSDVSSLCEIPADTTSEQNLVIDANSLSGQTISNVESQISLNFKTCNGKKKRRSRKDQNINMQASVINASIPELNIKASLCEDSISMLEELKSNNNDLDELGSVSLSNEFPYSNSIDIKTGNQLSCYDNHSSSENNCPSKEECNDVSTTYSNDVKIKQPRQKEVPVSFLEEMDELEKLIHETSNTESECCLSTTNKKKIKIHEGKNKTNCAKEDLENVCLTSKTVPVETYFKSDASNVNSCKKDGKDPATKSSRSLDTKMPKEAKCKKTKRGTKLDKNISKSSNKNQDSLAPPEVNKNDDSIVSRSFMEVGKGLQVKDVGSKSDQIINLLNDKFHNKKSLAPQQSKEKESKSGRKNPIKKYDEKNSKKKTDKKSLNDTDNPKTQSSHSCSNPENVHINSKNVSSITTAEVEYEQEKCKSLSHSMSEKTLPKVKTFKVSNERKDSALSKNDSLPLEYSLIEQINSSEVVGNENKNDLVTMDVTTNAKEEENDPETLSESAKHDKEFSNVLEGSENSIENKKKDDLVTKVEITKKNNVKNNPNSTPECIANVSSLLGGRINLIEKEKKTSITTKVETVKRKEETNTSDKLSELGKGDKQLSNVLECGKNFIVNEKKNALTSKVEITKNREEKKISHASSECVKGVENVSNILEVTTNFVENEKKNDRLTKVGSTKKKEEKSKPETSLDSLKIDAKFSNILESKLSSTLESKITNLSNSISLSNPLENPGAEPLDFNEDDLDLRDEYNRKKKEPLSTASKHMISTDMNGFKKKIESGQSKGVIISKTDTPKPIEKYDIPKKGTKLDDKVAESRINQQIEMNKLWPKDHKKSGEYSTNTGGDLQEGWRNNSVSCFGSSVSHKNDLLNKAIETFHDYKNSNKTSTKVDHCKRRDFIPEMKDYNDPPKTLEESKEYLTHLYGDLKSLCTVGANKNGALDSLKLKYKADIEKQNATYKNQFFRNTKGSNVFDLDITKDNTPHLLVKPMSPSKSDSLYYSRSFSSDSISKALNKEPETQIPQCIMGNTSTQMTYFQGSNDMEESKMDKIDVELPAKKDWFFKEKDDFIRKNKRETLGRMKELSEKGAITNILNKCPLKGNLKRSYRDKLGLNRDIVFLNEETFSEIGVIFWNDSEIKSCFKENFGGSIGLAGDITIPRRDALNIEPRFSSDEELSICASETSVNSEGTLTQCQSSDEKLPYELDDEVNYDELEESLKEDSVNNPLHFDDHSSPLKNIPRVLNDENETRGPEFMEEILESSTVHLNNQINTSFNEAVKLLISPFCKEFTLRSHCTKTYCKYKHKVPVHWVNIVSPVRTWEVIENVLLSYSVKIPQDWMTLIINWLQENGEINHILKICVFLGKSNTSNYCEYYCSLWALIVSSFNKLGLSYRVAIKLILEILMSSSLSKETLCSVLENMKIESYEKENVWSIVQCLQRLKDFCCPKNLFDKLLSEATGINKSNRDYLNFLFNQIMQRSSESLKNIQPNLLSNVIHLLEVNGFHKQQENIVHKLKNCNIYIRDGTKPNDLYISQRSSLDANQSKIILKPLKNSSSNEMSQVKENSFDTVYNISDMTTENPDNSNIRSSVININEVYENTPAFSSRFPNMNCSSFHSYSEESLKNHSVGNLAETFPELRLNYGLQKATAAISRNLSVKDYMAVLRVLEDNIDHNFVFDVARNCYLAIFETSPFVVYKELLETFVQGSHKNIYLKNILVSIGLTIALHYVRVSDWKAAHSVLKLLEQWTKDIPIYRILDGEYSQLRVGITICEIYFNNMDLRRACSLLIEYNLLGKNQSKWSLCGKSDEFYLIDATINALFLEIITKEKFFIGHSLFVAIFTKQKNLNSPIDLKLYYEKLLLGCGLHKKTLELYEMAEPKDKCLLSVPSYRLLVVVARRLGNKVLRRELFKKCSTLYTIYPTGNKNTIKMYSKLTIEEMMLMIEEWFHSFKQLFLDSFYTQTNTSITIKIEKTPIENDFIIPKLLFVDSSIEGAMQRLLEIPSKFNWYLPLEQIDEDKAQIPAYCAEMYVQQLEKDLC